MALNEILSAAQTNTFVRPYLFLSYCIINGVEVVQSGDEITQAVLVKTASLPSTTIGNVEVPYQGRKVNIPGDRALPADISMTIIYHKENNIHQKFHQAMANFQKAASTAINPEEFDLGANIMQIGVKNPANPDADTFHTYTLTGAIPTSIGAVEVSHETTDALLTFDVTIQYSYHTFA